MASGNKCCLVMTNHKLKVEVIVCIDITLIILCGMLQWMVKS